MRTRRLARGGGPVVDSPCTANRFDPAGHRQEVEDPDRAGEMDRILERFGEVQEEYEHLDGYALEAQAREVAATIGRASRA